MTNVKKDLRERVIENHTFYGLVSYVIKMTKSLYEKPDPITEITVDIQYPYSCSQ